MTSTERVVRLLNREPVDRVPIFDLLRNDAAIEYYSGGRLTFENAEELVYRAVSRIIDATRASVKYPVPESETVLFDGRKVIQRRWTTWNEPRRFADADEYESFLRKEHIEKDTDFSNLKDDVLKIIGRFTSLSEKIGDTYLFWSVGGVGLGYLHSEIGLDQFSYFLHDCPEVISEALEAKTEAVIRRILLLKELSKGSDAQPRGIFMAEDIAFKGTTMFSPAYLRKEFFPRLKRITDACHEAGWKFMFHSDGNLMEILDDFAEAGVDVLNPIETAAGMDIRQIHKRYPDLIMAGGIDTSNLLPFGKPSDIRDAVVKAIEDSEGRIMLGSSSEIHAGVPLENVIALYDTVLNYKL
ncbi:MAG TPA: uroporphyrinogen decarboxylase family protein [Clostridia bacterium]